MTQTNHRDGSKMLQPQNSLAYALAALLLCFGGNFCAGLVSTLMSTYLPNSIADLLNSTDPTEISYVGSYINSIYIAGWTLGGILFGWIGDRLGRAKPLSVSIGTIAIFTIAIYWVNNWYLLVLFRFIAGLGAGATMVLCAVYISEVWGKRVQGRAIAVSFLAIGFPIGIIGSGIVTHFVAIWRDAFLIGFLPFAISLICFFFLREPEQWSTITTPVEKKQSTDENTIVALFNPANRLNFLVSATIFGAMLVGIWSTFSWLPTWAQHLSGDDEAALQAGGTLIILLGMGGIVGAMISGFLANSMGRKTSLMIAFGGASVASMILYLSNSEFSGIIYFQTAFLALFFGISQGILTAYIPELFPTSLRSTATGVSFNAGRVVTATAVFFVGILVPILGGYGNSLFLFSFTYVIGFITVFFGKETKGSIL